MNEERRLSLVKFVEAERAEGASDDLLVDLLERRGWLRKEIHAAFAAVYVQQYS